MLPTYVLYHFAFNFVLLCAFRIAIIIVRLYNAPSGRPELRSSVDKRFVNIYLYRPGKRFKSRVWLFLRALSRQVKRAAEGLFIYIYARTRIQKGELKNF